MGGQIRQGDTLNGLSYTQVGRFRKRLTLASPFFGDVSYGGGAVGTEELWFWIVPAQETAFAPFGFGAQPKPLKKGGETRTAAGGRGTLTGGIGEFYYLQLPAGYWRFSFRVNTTALPPNLPQDREVLYSSQVDLLDEQGVSTSEAFPFTSFTSSSARRQGAEKLIKADVPEFVNLRVSHSAVQTGTPLGSPQVAPMAYVLTVEPASPAEYTAHPPGS